MRAIEPVASPSASSDAPVAPSTGAGPARSYERLAWTGVAALFGGLFALATPPTDILPLVWLALAGLDFACAVALPPRADPSGKRAWLGWLDGGGRGLAFGFGVSFVGLRFIPEVIARFTPLPKAAGVVALGLLALAQGVPWAVAAIVRNVLVKKRMPSALAFAIGVYAASFVPALFPWTPAGVVATWPVMIQLADVIGERGVAFLIALAAGLLALGVRQALDPRERRLAAIQVGLAVLVPCAMAGWGLVRMSAIEERRAHARAVPLGAINPTIPATTRWDPAAAPQIRASLQSLTDTAEGNGSLVTVWPETAYPYVIAHGAPREPTGDQTILRHGVIGPILVGAVTEMPNGDKLNSVLGLSRDGRFAASYDKMHLLWFGEEVPFAGVFPWLRRVFARGLGTVPGDAQHRLDMGILKPAALVCYEDTLPEAGREAALVDPNVLVNMSNDAWFTGSSESEIHLRFSVLRAVETRRDLVRAVNFGMTSFVDATGRIRKRFDTPVAGAMVAEVALIEGYSTVYTALGDWPGIVLCAGVAWFFWRRRDEAPTDGTPAKPKKKSGKKKAKKKSAPPPHATDPSSSES